MKYTSYLQATTFVELCKTIAMEECSELIQAISKDKRCKLDRTNLTEEIVDVIISINWILKIHNITDEEIDYWFNYKTNRIVKRLNSGDFK